MNTNTKSADVLMINNQGLMINVMGNDYFISYNRAPWFKDAKISDVLNVQMEGRNAIVWPTLDVDFEIESLNIPSVILS